MNHYRKYLPAIWILTIAAQAQISNFQHIVIIVQENRTPDNLFQGLCSPGYRCSPRPDPLQYNIQTSNWLDEFASGGTAQPRPVALANAYDLNHSHSSFVDMCDADQRTGQCRMDGAGKIPCGGTCLPHPQYRYVDNSGGIMDPYLHMVKQYGWANYMFETNQGPSYPAHQFLFGGTSAPSAADDAAGTFASENMSLSNDSAGCIAQAGTTVELIDPSGENSWMYPCFEHSTVSDLLTSGLTWRYYAPSAGSIWTAPNSIQHICQSSGEGGNCTGQEWTDNVDLTPSDVLTDIGACNLRSVSWVIPTGANSDHAGVNDGGGPSWVASIVNAIGTSDRCDNHTGYWNNTAILITWDDWGGWYDHEPPVFLAQPQGDYQYGFRVPLIVVSAYTPQGYIENNRNDFGSMIRFVEQNFGIQEGALNFADARATSDLTDFFDLRRAPRRFQAIKAPKDANFFLNDTRPATDPDDE